jgi:hypothetical protein
MNNVNWLAASVLVLAGCGGGGDGGTAAPTATATLTTDNAASVAGATTDAALNSSEMDELADLGLVLSPDMAAVMAYGSDTSVSLAKNSAQLQATTALVTVGPEIVACPVSGSMSVSGDITNPETLSPGDSFSATYTNCGFADGIVSDGTISFRVTSFQGDLGGDQFDLGFDVTVNQLLLTDPVETVTFDGDFSMQMNTNGTISRVTISGNSLSLANGTESYSLSRFSTTATADISMFPQSFTIESEGYLMTSEFDGEVHFSTSIAFQGNGEGNPVGGELIITGAGNATIKVIPLDGNNVRLELDLDGDGAIDENGIVDLTWQELLDLTA